MIGEIPSTGVTVLVVEDEKVVLRLVTRVLERAGFRVLPAGDAQEALAATERVQEPPALVISDLVLPASRGGDLARRLRERWPSLPILFTSGRPMDGGDLPEGATFLAKPFSPEDLVKTARSLLDRPGRPQV